MVVDVLGVVKIEVLSNWRAVLRRKKRNPEDSIHFCEAATALPTRCGATSDPCPTLQSIDKPNWICHLRVQPFSE